MTGIPVVLGTALFGTTVSREDAFRVLDRYALLGGRTLDTANNYAYWHPEGKGGESESVIGSWLERQDRRAFTVVTKIGSQPFTGEDGMRRLEGLSPEAVRRAADRCLDRLKTRRIDVLLAHHDDPGTPLLDTWRAFSDLVSAGKVGKVGISNYSVRRVAELARIVREHSLAPVDVVQMKGSVIDPAAGADFGMLVPLDRAMRETLERLLPHALVLAYSPLLGGRVFEQTATDGWPAGYDSAENRAKVAEIRRRAGELGVSPSACVLKEMADQKRWPVTTTSDPDRLEANLKLFGVGRV